MGPPAPTGKEAGAVQKVNCLRHPPACRQADISVWDKATRPDWQRLRKRAAAATVALVTQQPAGRLDNQSSRNERQHLCRWAEVAASA